MKNFYLELLKEIQNKSSNVIELYPYAQITRNVAPDVTGSMLYLYCMMVLLEFLMKILKSMITTI